ncbi:MAG: OmpA family protein [Acidobacteriia bacterium]|nr:OmpA family protein [Terriglobia bacterium]
MSRRKKTGAHANHERWLVSYADFITLLFAFFVVLYASSQTDQRKIGKLALAIQVAFQELGVFQASTTHVPMNQSEPMPFSNAQLIDNIDRSSALGKITPGVPPSSPALPGLEDRFRLKKELEKALAPELRRKEIEFRDSPDGMILSLNEMGFYDPGSDAVRHESEGALARVAEVLRHRPNRLRIEGHTDTVPIHTARFPSNWELSTARASGLVRIFITRFDFAPGRLSAAGFAEYHPVSSNETNEGRSQNRRVDIVILSGPPLTKIAGGAQAQTRKIRRGDQSDRPSVPNGS